MILAALVRKEWLEIVRDPITLGVAIFLPLILLFVFGYGISLDVEDVRLGVYDQDRTQASERLVEAFTASGYFRVTRRFPSLDEAAQALDRGRVTVALVIPPDFSRLLAADRTAPVQLLVDGTFSPTALIVSNYATAIVNTHSMALAERRLETLGLRMPGRVSVASRVWYNAPMRSVNYIVPGLFAVLLMAFPPMLTALAIVREKERGTIEQIYVSPVSAPLYILGKVLPYAAIAFVEMLLILTVGTFWFQVPLQGSLALLLGASLLYVLATVGIGVFVSTITRTQVGAVFLSLVVTLMPSFLFSGFLFPISTMPYMMQLYTYVFPARYFNDISRDLFLKGVGIEYIWWNVLLLVLYAAVIFIAASLRLKKKVA
ncbi:MAG: ABC transporter permease [Betaproteobacteria bacterium]|nr:ABC transporter permease [Betaproteobacteria bacterium]